MNERSFRCQGGLAQWPDRLYLVGSDGSIAYKSEAGPFGFRPEDLRTAIEAALRHR